MLNSFQFQPTSVTVQMAREKINATQSADNKPTSLPRTARFASSITKNERQSSFLSDRGDAHQKKTKNIQSAKRQTLSASNRHTITAFVKNSEVQKDAAEQNTHTTSLRPPVARQSISFSPLSSVARLLPLPLPVYAGNYIQSRTTQYHTSNLSNQYPPIPYALQTVNTVDNFDTKTLQKKEFKKTPIRKPTNTKHEQVRASIC